MNQATPKEPGSCLAVCPVCGSQCKKEYHSEQVLHECPNGHTSKTKEPKWKQYDQTCEPINPATLFLTQQSSLRRRSLPIHLNAPADVPFPEGYLGTLDALLDLADNATRWEF